MQHKRPHVHPNWQQNCTLSYETRFTPRLTKTHLLVSEFHLEMTTSEMSNVGDAKLETYLCFGGIPLSSPDFKKLSNAWLVCIQIIDMDFSGSGNSQTYWCDCAGSLLKSLERCNVLVRAQGQQLRNADKWGKGGVQSHSSGLQWKGEHLRSSHIVLLRIDASWLSKHLAAISCP